MVHGAILFDLLPCRSCWGIDDVRILHQGLCSSGNHLASSKPTTYYICRGEHFWGYLPIFCPLFHILLLHRNSQANRACFSTFVFTYFGPCLAEYMHVP
ncbi:hypothetical protein DFH27DRAFT_564702 [Peziza echinospora]|nr:hypothetical protein DFH27DRAFT_564702 [Peziza echinospora]